MFFWYLCSLQLLLSLEWINQSAEFMQAFCILLSPLPRFAKQQKQKYWVEELNIGPLNNNNKKNWKKKQEVGHSREQENEIWRTVKRQVNISKCEANTPFIYNTDGTQCFFCIQKMYSDKMPDTCSHIMISDSFSCKAWISYQIMLAHVNIANVALCVHMLVAT